MVAANDARLPVLVGTGRRTWHPGADPAPEPLDMWELVARVAADDVGVDRDVLGAVDDLSVVHCQSWAYDAPARRAAELLGLGHARVHDSILAGTSPQRLIDAAASRMIEGSCEVALVVGAEAFATRKRFARAGEAPPWRFAHPDPPALPVDLETWYLPTEIAHGVLPAWLTFALLEQARWAHRGGRAEDRRDLAVVLGRLNAVASANPDAWFRAPAPGEVLVSPSGDNRMVATPYTKRATAFMDVDMAAANLLVTKEVADRWGVPADRRAYLRGWGFARDEVHIAGRRELASSPGMRAATSEALQAAGVSVDDISAFDLYSCFGSAVQFACDALGLDVRDRRPITLAGGLPYHGGPSSNYLGHATSHLLDHLREHPDQLALTTGVGMHMTKHVAAVWSSAPGAIYGPHEHGPQRWAATDPGVERTVRDSWTGPASLVAASVVYGGDGAATHVVGICELDDGGRCYVRTTATEAIAAVRDDSWAGRSVEVVAGGEGINELRL
jgi:acetyl-CoA C-acetyltransferase